MANDINQWLEGLGLGRYINAINDNDIDFDVLPRLSDDDLKDLGFSLGDRRRLQAAISELGGSETPPATNEGSHKQPPSKEAERRQLTVMFCDLGGSTALSTRVDPEDYREVIRSYQDACAGVVTEYGGYVAKFMGDGVLAYFGWPQAQEDDARQATSAGLGIVAAVADIAPPEGEEPLVVRVGIATGPVVVGDIIGEGSAQETAVTGETPNLAARLQQIAGPNGVVVAAATHRLAGGLFAYEPLDGVSLDGIEGMTEVWRVTGELRVESRFAAAHGGELTPLIGRDEELQILVRRWERAKSGDGQMVLLSGEPGIGKSRLTRALRGKIGDEPHTWLLYQCSPHHASSALHPIISQLEQAARIEAAEEADKKLDKLEILLARADAPNEDIVPLIASLLSIPSADRYPPPDLTPQQQKVRTLAALGDQLAGLAAQQPVLLAFEDAHWIDPTSLEFLELATQQITDLPVLIIVTYRPEFVPPWAGLPHVTLQALNRLDDRECAAMARQLTGKVALPAQVMAQLVKKADGVPLFIEELTRSVVDARAASKRAEEVAPATPTQDLGLVIPATLQEALEARLDRSPQAKEVAQLAAAIGREFSYRLLAAASSLDAASIDSGLDELTRLGLVTAHGVPPDTRYTFRHALIQDTAYDSLLRSSRQAFHRSIAAALEKSFPSTAEAEPEILAHHYTQAGAIDQAIDHWLLAGERAHERSANAEAIAHLTQGLQLLETLPESADRDRRELTLLVKLGVPLQAIKGPASPEVEHTYERARELCQSVEKAPELLPVLWGLWRNELARGNIVAAKELVDEILRVAQNQEDSALILQAHHAQWATLFDYGDFAAALEHIDRGIALYDRAEHHAQALMYGGHDLYVCGQGHAGLLVWTIGYPDQALARSHDGLAVADELDHPETRAHALRYVIKACLFRREPWAVAEWADQMIALASEHKMVDSLAVGTFMRGWALAQDGQLEDGVSLMRRGLAAGKASGRREEEPSLLVGFAQALGDLGELEEGCQLLDHALSVGVNRGLAYWDAELLRVKGELSLASSVENRTKAKRLFVKALAAARRRGARALELRAAMSLARFLRDQGCPDEAREMLAPVYGWFTEGFDTPDLKDAKALLDELV